MVVDFPPPARVCFWTGAGISADYPTALPLGDDLTQMIVSRVCGAGVWEEARRDFRAMGMVGASGRSKTAPRLEWVAEHLWRVVHDDALKGFRAFVGAAPNELHRFFASHLSLGGRHITMNFDRCIEDAQRAPGLPGHPLHLHGALSPTGLGNLRTRTVELNEGLRGEDADLVISSLERSELLVFLGYSGRDYFDVDPFFRELARSRPGRLRSLRVVWLEHRADAQALEPLAWRGASVIDGRPILESLERMGASVTYVHGPSQRLLAQAASAWGGRVPFAASAGASGTARAALLDRAAAEIAVSRIDQLRSTAVFWFSMGAGKRILELDRRLASSNDPTEQQLRGELLDMRRIGLMSVGRYRQAAGLARSLEDPVHRHQALASAHAHRGSVGRALWHVLRALELCGRPTSNDPGFADHCGDARERYLTMYRAARGSALGPLVSVARRCVTEPPRLLLRRDPWFDPVRVFEQFRDCEAYVDAHPHAVEQIARAWRDVPEFERTGPLPEAIVDRQAKVGSVFVETDHFLGYINSERERLAGAVRECHHPDGAGVGPFHRELRLHRERATRQADLPGQLKATLLERAAGHAAAPFPRAALRSIEWNLTKKALWVLSWVFRRLP